MSEEPDFSRPPEVKRSSIFRADRQRKFLILSSVVVTTTISVMLSQDGPTVSSVFPQFRPLYLFVDSPIGLILWLLVTFLFGTIRQNQANKSERPAIFVTLSVTIFLLSIPTSMLTKDEIRMVQWGDVLQSWIIGSAIFFVIEAICAGLSGFLGRIWSDWKNT